MIHEVVLNCWGAPRMCPGHVNHKNRNVVHNLSKKIEERMSVKKFLPWKKISIENLNR